MSSHPLRIGFIEPHLKRFGGIRRILELSNRLVDRGHDVSLLLPETEEHRCEWMRCRADVLSITQGFRQPFDVVVFNHEPDWHMLPLFEHRPARVFFALHYARLYGKEGSWESLRAPVDLRLANSTWTAERIADEIGERPAVLLGGINAEHFRPVPGVPKRYPILSVGDGREWKGQATIEAAAEILQLPVEAYSHKDLPQSAMAEEYARAEVFVVGSRFEGFGQPGLEALACGVPLVTTDNGGCRDYAIHEETALVVPPDDPQSMAAAIARLRRDPLLAQRLVESGLKIVREKFDWERSAGVLEQHLRAAVDNAEAGRDRPALSYSPPPEPELSVVVLAWDQLHLTQRCIESIRQHTNIPYELIIVDNGSAWEAANYARVAADVSVLNERNLGFAHGMQQGLEAAQGTHIAFCNNDTVLPPGWASLLVQHLKEPDVGVVVPAVTNARDPRIVREEPGEEVERLLPFEAPPPAVMYVMNRATASELGGWGLEYEIASAEDMDLCFKAWVNDLAIIFDSRVLVKHVSKGTAGSKLDDWRAIWARNREIFLDKWTSSNLTVPRLDRCDPDVFDRNLLSARAAAGWMRRYFDALARARSADLQARSPSASAPHAPAHPSPAQLPPPRARRVVRKIWDLLRPAVPKRLRESLFRLLRRHYYRYYPERL